MSEEEKLEKIIKEITEICKKYNVYMWSCECCGGINIIDKKTEEPFNEDIYTIGKE